MATNRRWKGQDGVNREETTWFRIAVYGRQAQTTAQFLQKGRRVLVTGRVSARAFIGNDGQARASMEIVAQDVRFLSGRDDVDAGDGSFGGQSGGGEPSSYVQPAAADRPPPSRPASPPAEEVDDFDDDDIPF